MLRMPTMRGKVRSIRGLRATSTTMLIFNWFLAAWPVVARGGAAAGGLILLLIGLVVRRAAERRAVAAPELLSAQGESPARGRRRALPALAR
jgi:hypothetical protein